MANRGLKSGSKAASSPKSGSSKVRYIRLGGSVIVSPATGEVVETSAKVVKVPAPRKVRAATPPAPRDAAARIVAALIRHLGSQEAADAWLDSPDTGYPTTARDAMRDGHADYVLRDLQAQWGPNPPYA